MNFVKGEKDCELNWKKGLIERGCSVSGEVCVDKIANSEMV